jgi:hypothetical protein
MAERLIEPFEPQFADAGEKIGGWLAFFTVTCCLGISVLIVRTVRARPAPILLYDLLLIATTGLLVACLFARSPLVFAALWSQSVLRVLAVLYNLHRAWALHRIALDERASSLAYAQGYSVVIMAVWLLYFRFSKRVFYTLGRNL